MWGNTLSQSAFSCKKRNAYETKQFQCWKNNIILSLITHQQTSLPLHLLEKTSRRPLIRNHWGFSGVSEMSGHTSRRNNQWVCRGHENCFWEIWKLHVHMHSSICHICHIPQQDNQAKDTSRIERANTVANNEVPLSNLWWDCTHKISFIYQILCLERWRVQVKNSCCAVELWWL